MFGFLISKLMPFKWWIIAGSLFVAAYAGWYARATLEDANQKEELRLALEKRNLEDRNAHEVETIIRSLPDGVASKRLYLEWQRDEGR